MLTPKVDLNYLFSRYSSPPLGQSPDGQDAVDVAVLIQTPCRQGGMLTYLVPAAMKSCRTSSAEPVGNKPADLPRDPPQIDILVLLL